MAGAAARRKKPFSIAFALRLNHLALIAIQIAFFVSFRFFEICKPLGHL